MKFPIQPLASGLLAATAILSACGGGGNTPTGTLRLAMTDGRRSFSARHNASTSCH